MTSVFYHGYMELTNHTLKNIFHYIICKNMPNMILNKNRYRTDIIVKFKIKELKGAKL